MIDNINGTLMDNASIGDWYGTILIPFGVVLTLAVFYLILDARSKREVKQK